MKIQELVPTVVDSMPEVLENGILYLCPKYKTAIHLCACGCGVKTVTPLNVGGWILSGQKEFYTLIPSMGNFSGESPYHAHYLITNNKIEWC